MYAPDFFNRFPDNGVIHNHRRQFKSKRPNSVVHIYDCSNFNHKLGSLIPVTPTDFSFRSIISIPYFCADTHFYEMNFKPYLYKNLILLSSAFYFKISFNRSKFSIFCRLSFRFINWIFCFILCHFHIYNFIRIQIQFVQ